MRLCFPSTEPVKADAEFCLQKDAMSGKPSKRTNRDLRALLPVSDLRPETGKALDAMQHRVVFRSGQVVSHEGEKSDFVGIVASGILRMQKTLMDGRHPIVGLLVRGDIFGCTFDGASELAIEAATDAEVYAFPRVPFEALVSRSPNLNRIVLLNILNGLDRAGDWMVILSNQKVVNRVAGFLLMMCTRFAGADHLVQPRPSGIEIKIPVSRLDLAQLLGTRPESISRALHRLADSGDIDLVAPDHIVIKDVAALAEKAGEEEFKSSAALRDLMAEKRRRR